MQVRSFGILAVALGALVAQPLRSDAVGPDVNLKANTYSANLVQAMDECMSAVTNVGGVAACTSSNVSTDGTNFSIGRVIIRSRLSQTQVRTTLKSSGASVSGALANKVIHTEIVLRVTRTLGGPVTWVDQTLDCPNVTVSASGDMSQKVSLVDCGLAPALAENSTNKEVLSVQVVDNVSGKPIAVPGVRRRK